MTSYENARDLIESAPVAKAAGTRDVKWMTDAHVVGVARDAGGRVEVFLRGEELRPISSNVRDAIEFRVVHRHDQPPFDANRLLLPPLGHFDQVAAFICTELLRAGADESLARAFAHTEPIIELAIERLRLSYQAQIGLAGELLLIDALCRRGSDSKVASTISGWAGWRRSSRDLTIGTTGIEVKTTTGLESSHLVEGVHQLELNDGSDGSTPEGRLILVSIGLQPRAAGGNAFTIPQLVDRIIAHMTRAGLNASDVETFLFRVAEYGASSGEGYDHHTQASDSAHTTPFLTSFFRAYDMTDGAIQVLRRHDLTAFQHVDSDSVRFRVELPVAVSAGNPIVGANQAAEVILR